MLVFGRYRLVRRIGAGGMAEIWKAKVEGPAGFEKVLAIKKILPELAEDRPFVEMFIEEAKLVAQLVHPNVVSVFDFGAVDDEYFIAMEYVPGANLARILKQVVQREFRVSPEVAIYVGTEVAKGLNYAHTKTDSRGTPLSIVHRDCTPHNILVSFNGEVKISDFGIAKATTAKSRTSGGQVRGKLAYMSPEQALGNAIDARTDLFALGVTLYELCTGVRLFANVENEHEIYGRVIGFEGLSAEQMEIVPETLRPILQCVLQPDANKRYPHARAMELALATLITPDQAIGARETLARLMAQLFEREYLLEIEPAQPAPISMTPDPGLVLSVTAETGSVPTGSSGAQQIVSSTVISPEPGAAGDLSAPTVAWGPKVQERPAPAGSAPRARGYGLYAAVFLIAMLVIGAIGGLAKVFRHGELATPTATPLAIATATPAPTATTSAAVTATATPVATATRVALASHTHAVIARTPTPTPRAVARAGFLFVTAQPWVEVWLDGKKVAKETPVRGLEVPSGKHTLRFVHVATKKELEQSVEIPSGGNLSLFVDVAAGKVEPN